MQSSLTARDANAFQEDPRKRVEEVSVGGVILGPQEERSILPMFMGKDEANNRRWQSLVAFC